MRPLSFLGGQLLSFFEPMVGSMYESPHYQTLVKILEDRQSYDELVRRVEAKAAEKDG